MIPLLGTVSKSWMADEIGVAFDHRYYFDPPHRHAIDAWCNEYLCDHLPDLNLFFTESNLGRLSHYNPRQTLVGGIQPNMILGMLVGAEFIPQASMDADISPAPLAGVEVEDLPRHEKLFVNELIARLDQQFRDVRSGRFGDLEPVPPFFWDGSGRSAVHGPLTTAQKLFGESIFMELVASPELAAARLDWVADATIGLVEHFASLAKREITEIHVGECSACMVSADVFSTFVMPVITKIGLALGPIRLHSCGTSDHLLPAFAKIDQLHSLDTGGVTSVAAVRDTFGHDFRLEIAPLVDDLLGSTPEPLLAWADRVIAENAGGPLSIVYHLEQGYHLDHLRALRDHIEQQTI